MATLDDSPSLFSGQQWTDWADVILPELDSVVEDDGNATANIEEDSMKLRKEDMPLFGLCPSQDEFYLVVCEKCNHVLKPQAFKAHLDVRHGGKGGFTTVNSASTKVHQSSRHSASSKSHSKSHTSPSKSHSKLSKSHSSSSPRKSGHISHHSSSRSTLSSSASDTTAVLKLTDDSYRLTSQDTVRLSPDESVRLAEDISVRINLKDARLISSEDRGRLTPIETCRIKLDPDDVKYSIHNSSSVSEPPQSLHTAARVGAQYNTHHKVKDSKLKKNHTMPVVKMERMPETLAMKKQRESTGSARTSLTNGSIRNAKSPPMCKISLNESLEVDTKPIFSPPPVLSAPHTPVAIATEMEPLPLVPASEINEAVNAILEPFSLSEAEADNNLALATSSSTLTTNTVTMATLTLSSAAVTSVTNTTSASSFTFNNLGRPQFPMGSIRVNFSSTGVLSSLTGVSNISASTTNSNNNNNNLTKTSLTSDTKTSVCNNGSIESTISDIVKSTINVSNHGGFKSLSPLLTSPVKNSGSPVFSHSLKSPTGIGGPIKSFSATSGSKPGSKLSMGCSNVFKSLSTGNVTNNGSTSPGSNSAPTTPSADALKKFQLLNKPDKIIPLKDREYDANKHCGVMVTETGKACTRSLTCKSHALSLRRAVPSRRLPFDDLLQEHRDAKEAYLKAKLESKEAAAALKAANTPNKGGGVQVSPLGKSHSNTSMSSLSSSKPAPQGLSKENKSISSPGFSSLKSHSPQKLSSSDKRPSFSSLQLSSSSLDECQSPLGKSSDRLLIDEEEESSIKNDSSTNYHPRPIAACSFGARYHNNYSGGLGCHTFGRKTDHLRAAFLDLLERHLHPPPPKKLCVESNLPKENETLQGSTDPYDFGFLDPSKKLIGHQVVQQQSANIVTAAIPTKVVSKPKSKPSATISNTIGNQPKFKDGPSLSKTVSIGNVPSVLNSSAKKRRTSSGAVGNVIPQAGNLGQTLGSANSVTMPNIIGSVGSITNSTGTAVGAAPPQFAIAIPNNISGATLSHINASLMASGNFKHGKNNVIKDMGFVVTGIPQEALLNGQYVNISRAQLAGGGDMGLNQVQQVTANQIHQVTPTQIHQVTANQVHQLAPGQLHHVSNKLQLGNDDGSKALHSTQVFSNNKTTSQPKFINSINSLEAFRAIQAGKSNVLNLPPNTFLLEGGTVLQPVSLATASANPVMSVGNTAFTQQNLASTPSPHLNHSGSASPQVSTSPVPNGVVVSTAAITDKELVLSHRQTVFQSKGHPQQHIPQRGTIQQASHLFTGAQLQNQNFTFQGPASSSSLTNQISANTSQVLNSQLTQLQVKNSNIHKSSSVNKLTMQPVSLTIPFVTQNNVGGVGMGTGGQQTTHALYITSEDAQKQGLHLHQAEQQAQNSPSNTLIS